MGNTPNIAIVTTLRNAGRMLDSFIAYHLAVGFSHIFLFFDDPTDPDLPRMRAHPAITAVAHDEALREAWKSLSQYEAQRAFIDCEVMARQVLNAELAMGLARARGFDWLLHIDSDELFYSPHQSVPAHFAALEGQSFDTMNYPNFESVPERVDIGDAFREVDLFKPPAHLAQFSPAATRLVQATPQLLPNFFHFYASGKSAVRLAAQDMRPMGVHDFIRADGTYPGTRSTRHFILHYACCGFENFWTKYVTLGRFPDTWWNTYDIAASIGPFHLQARDIVATGDRDAARAFYRQRLAIEDGKHVGALMAAGVLQRILEPRRILGAAAAPPPR